MGADLGRRTGVLAREPSGVENGDAVARFADWLPAHRRLGGIGVLDREELGGVDKGDCILCKLVDALAVLDRGDEGALVQLKEKKVDENKDATNRDALRGRPRCASTLGPANPSDILHSPRASPDTSGAATRLCRRSTEATLAVSET